MSGADAQVGNRHSVRDRLVGRRRSRLPGAQVAIVGAGPSGLATAAMLERRGIPTVVLEATDRLASPWHDHYDGLRLQSPYWMSHLPGLRFERADGTWVTRDGFLGYLSRYVDHHELDVRHRQRVGAIEQVEGAWSLRTAVQEWTAAAVVVATGYNRVPVRPAWPGVDRWSGTLLHASEYRDPSPFRGRDVLVVGTGNSGAEISYQLTVGGARRVRLAVRSAPNVVPRAVAGLPSLIAAAAVEPLPLPVADAVLHALNRPVVGDLTRHGLPRSSTGMYTQYVETDVTPIIDTGFLGALRSRSIEPVAAVTDMREGDVGLADGRRIRPEVVIAATGYRRGLEDLVGHMGALAEDGRPHTAPDGLRTGVPGLFFLGYTHPFSGNLRRVRRDAPRLARVIAAHLDGRDSPRLAPLRAPAAPEPDTTTGRTSHAVALT